MSQPKETNCRKCGKPKSHRDHDPNVELGSYCKFEGAVETSREAFMSVPDFLAGRYKRTFPSATPETLAIYLSNTEHWQEFADSYAEYCLRWHAQARLSPEAIPLIAGASSLEREAAANVALDGDTRRCCNHPDCANDWPCPIHSDCPRCGCDKITPTDQCASCGLNYPYDGFANPTSSAIERAARRVVEENQTGRLGVGGVMEILREELGVNHD